MTSTAMTNAKTVKIKKLDPSAQDDTMPNLSLEDTCTQLQRGITPTGRTGRSGSNPYDTVPNAAAGPKAAAAGLDRNAEMRKLSAWIRQKRAAADLKSQVGSAGDENGSDQD
jgi:hypothetical protein